QSQGALQLNQQIADLRLQRTTESRERLIQNEEFGLERQRAGDSQPLALAATQLHGGPSHNVLGKTDPSEPVINALFYFFAIKFALQNQRLNYYIERTSSSLQ